jgi:hypothetical protein
VPGAAEAGSTDANRALAATAVVIRRGGDADTVLSPVGCL